MWIPTMQWCSLSQEVCHSQEQLGTPRNQGKSYSLKFLGFISVTVFKNIAKKVYILTIKLLFYSAKQLLKWHPGVLHLIFHRTSLLSLQVKRYFLTTGHTDQQRVHEQCFSLSPVIVSQQHYAARKLCLSAYFSIFLSLSPFYLPCSCIDTNKDSIWSCTFLAAHCYKNRK